MIVDNVRERRHICFSLYFIQGLSKLIAEVDPSAANIKLKAQSHTCLLTYGDHLGNNRKEKGSNCWNWCSTSYLTKANHS